MRIAFVIVLAVFQLCIPCTQLQAQLNPAQTDPTHSGMLASLPRIDSLATISTAIHLGLGWFTAELGDLNDDGYDDYAVTSSLDTTFIFYGGDPIPYEPAFYILGGSGGVAAGDFNGDGLMDIATTIKPNLPGNHDPDRHGYIRVYYNTGMEPAFHVLPDQVISGPTMYSMWGYWARDTKYPGIKRVDFNGDGRQDLLCFCLLEDPMHRDGAHQSYIIFFGGDSLSTTPDIHFLVPARGDEKSYEFRGRYYLGDVNGDGCTDFLFSTSYYDEYPYGNHSQLDLYLGNTNGESTYPYISIPIDNPPFWSDLDYPAFADLNNDGYDEFIGASQLEWGSAPYFYGRAEFTQFEIDDSLRNPDVDILYAHQGTWPVGDMNGDGTRDVLSAWITDLIRTTYGYFLFPNLEGKTGNNAIGVLGVDIEIEDLGSGVYPIGDVNGDGYDDVIMTGRPPDAPGWRGRKIKIFGGNGRLVGISPTPTLPTDANLSVYPNPVPYGTRQLTIGLKDSGSGPATIHLRNVLGQTVLRKDIEISKPDQLIQISFPELRAGYYHVSVAHGDRIEGRGIIVR